MPTIAEILKQTPPIHEILEAVNNAPKKDRVETLRRYPQRSVKQTCIYLVLQPKFLTDTLDALVWRENTEDSRDTISSLFYDINKLKYFLASHSPALPLIKRKQMLSQMFENISKQEVDLIINIMKGVNPYKNITKNIVKDAFPDLKL